MKPFVSVLVPVYNVEEYLKRCLDSILVQKFTNIEIICVNDGSTDNSTKILEEYRKKDSRIIVVEKKNGGLPSARNAGLEVAKGEYISFVDSDDYIEANMIKKLHQVAVKDNSEVVICGAHIFPENPRAEQWFYDKLSPARKRYDQYDPLIIFEDITTTPFLWRVFVKKDLIDRHHLRLNEEISLGEDFAFQVKLYSRAKGISLIPDKLYHYMWHREKSLMQELNYKNPEVRVIKHIELLEEVWSTLELTSNDEKTRCLFINWGLDFVYQDFIYLSHLNKVKYADKIMSCMEQAKYHNHKLSLGKYITRAYDYIVQFKDAVGIEPLISIVCVMEGQGMEYLAEMIDSVTKQTEKAFELILINNNVDVTNYEKVQQYMFAEQRIRVMNIPRSKYFEALNKGVLLASSPRIIFIEPFSWLHDKFSLEKIVGEKSDYDLCVTSHSVMGSSSYLNRHEVIAGEMRDIERALIGDFQDIVYRTDFLQESNVRFRESGRYTGFEFLVHACVQAKQIKHLPETIIVHRNMFEYDWISTEKCGEILEITNDLLDLAIEKEIPFLQYLLVEKINNDRMKKMLVNNTLPWKDGPDNWQNDKGSQVDIILLLMKICEKVSVDVIRKYSSNLNHLDTLCEMISRRHKWLGEIEY